MLYKPWRRWFDEQRRIHQQQDGLEEAIDQSDVVLEPCRSSERTGEQKTLPSDSNTARSPVIKSSSGTDTTTP